MRHYLFPIVFLFSILGAEAQGLTCSVTAVPLTVRAEGVTERVGDISLICSGGQPLSTVTGNFSVFLDVPITNRLSANNVTDVQFTYDVGAGPQPIAAPGVLVGGLVTFAGASFPLGLSGGVSLKMFNIRGNMTQTAPGTTGISATLLVNGAGLLPLNQNKQTVAYVSGGLLDGFVSSLVCEQRGSPGPLKPGFGAFLSSGSAFDTTRITEGFTSSFEPRSNQVNFNADSGERIMITYSGFPASAQLFVPDVIVGSSGFRPTSDGDFGVAPWGGTYEATSQGSLLLARVYGADANGAGGRPVYFPGPPGSDAANFDAVNSITFTNGTGSVVYEVMDASPFTLESAQVPAFLVLPANSVSGNVFTTEQVSFAPVSQVATADSAAPVPRFVAVTPGPDCVLLGDCGAAYFPQASVTPNVVTLNGVAGGGGKAQYVQVKNAGGGTFTWQTAVTYTAGQPSNWIQLGSPTGVGNGSIYVYGDPSKLTAGTYTATISVTTGNTAPPAVITVTFNVAAAPPPVSPTISGLTSAADFHLSNLVPGSLATVFGANFGANGATVTFAAQPAMIFFENDTQINLLVPASLAGMSSAPVIVTAADGQSSAASQAALVDFAPGVFANGVLNQDYSPNTATTPAKTGTVIQIFATGVSGPDTVTAKLGATQIDSLEYVGIAPGLVGVQQVNMLIPAGSATGVVNLEICGAVGQAAPICSTPYPVYVSK